jgi:ankyrin repeat protein
MATLLRNIPAANKATVTHRAGQKRSLSVSVGHLDCMQQSPADFVKNSVEENSDEGKNSQEVSFLKPTEEMISAYKVELINVFRENDIEKCRELHKDGQSFQCCNRFGESLIHMACRRGWTDLVKFLVLEAGCSLLVQDDYGRTPFHDACWTPEPNFKLVEFLMEQVPELLSVTDVRGHTPFSYVRKTHWTVWRQFLEGRRSLLRPKKVAKVTATTSE